MQESDPPFYFPALKIALSGESKRETREGIETRRVAYACFNQTGGTGLSGCWCLIYLKLVVFAFNASTWRRGGAEWGRTAGCSANCCAVPWAVGLVRGAAKTHGIFCSLWEQRVRSNHRFVICCVVALTRGEEQARKKGELVLLSPILVGKAAFLKPLLSVVIVIP